MKKSIALLGLLIGCQEIKEDQPSQVEGTDQAPVDVEDAPGEPEQEEEIQEEEPHLPEFNSEILINTVLEGNILSPAKECILVNLSIVV